MEILSAGSHSICSGSREKSGFAGSVRCRVDAESLRVGTRGFALSCNDGRTFRILTTSQVPVFLTGGSPSTATNPAGHPQAGQATREAIHYCRKNRRRLDDARFRQAGCMIGSGTVESGRKQTVTQRLKRSGARWTQHRGRMTAKARAAYLSEQLDELSRFRAPMARVPNNV
jgi:hypothetical protein